MESMHDQELEGKVALVTGASKGIGAEIAARLAAEGAAVAVNYSASKKAADRVVAAIIAKGGKAVAVHGNLADAKDVKKVVAETVKAFGAIDILVNNAGIYEFAPLEASRPSISTSISTSMCLACCWSRRKQRSTSTPWRKHHQHQLRRSTIAPANTAVYTATKASVDAISSVLSRSWRRARSASTPSIPA